MATLFHFTVLPTIIYIAASEIITCSDPFRCSWICPEDGSCNDNTYHCPSIAPICRLQCKSCHNLTIYSSSDQFTIICTNPEGCANMEITTQTHTSKIDLRCLKSMSNCQDITFNCQRSISNCQCFDSTKNNCNSQINFESETLQPTDAPSENPTNYPTKNPSKYPTQNPNKYPTKNPVKTGNTLQAHKPTETRTSSEGIAVESTIIHTIDLQVDSENKSTDSTYHLLWIGVAIFFTGCIAMALFLQLYTKFKKSKLNRTKCKSIANKSFDETQNDGDNNNQEQNEEINIDKIQIEGAETNALSDEMDNNNNNAQVSDKSNAESNNNGQASDKPAHIVQDSNAESNNNAFEGICISPVTNSDIEAMYKIQRSTIMGNSNAEDDDASAASRCVDEIEFTESNIEKPLPVSPLPGQISVDNNENQEVMLEKIWNNGPIVIE